MFRDESYPSAGQNFCKQELPIKIKVDAFTDERSKQLIQVSTMPESKTISK